MVLVGSVRSDRPQASTPEYRDETAAATRSRWLLVLAMVGVAFLMLAAALAPFATPRPGAGAPSGPLLHGRRGDPPLRRVVPPPDGLPAATSGDGVGYPQPPSALGSAPGAPGAVCLSPDARYAAYGVGLAGGLTRGREPGRRDRAEPLARPTRAGRRSDEHGLGDHSYLDARGRPASYRRRVSRLRHERTVGLPMGRTLRSPMAASSTSLQRTARASRGSRGSRDPRWTRRIRGRLASRRRRSRVHPGTGDLDR